MEVNCTNRNKTASCTPNSESTTKLDCLLWTLDSIELLLKYIYVTRNF